MPDPRSSAVDEFLSDLVHTRLDEIVSIREALLAIDLPITERVKWNAPSFCVDGDDRVTMRLQPKDRVELIFHRGSKRRDDVDSFQFDDPTGWLVWASPDRGVLALADAAETAERLPRIADLAHAWMLATRA